MMSSMRGGFRSAVHGAAGAGAPRQTSAGRRWLSNLVTAALIVAAAVVLLRRFGVLH
jgi:hypothetical protein